MVMLIFSFLNFSLIFMQREVWDKEYQNLTLLTGEDKPQKDVTRFLRWLKKQGANPTDLKVLDLGSGTGRNTNYLASLGNKCVGMEISDTAIHIAKRRAREAGLNAQFINASIGAKFPFPDNTYDLLIDVTSSNSLDIKELNIFRYECQRVLKPGGYFFIKTLCLDGDKNAKELLKKFPGSEGNTYVMPNLGLEERVFSEKFFRGIYEVYFKIIELNKKTSYTRFNDRSYKRNFWLAYLQKPVSPPAPTS